MRVRILLAALLALAAAPTRAADEQLVYWPLVTDGTEYRRVAYPVEAGPLLVLAGHETVIDLRRAPVSYWPITREYLADLSASREPVEGRIEVVDAAGAVTTIAPEPYLLWYAKGVGAGPAELVRGERVAGFYRDYVARARMAAENLQAYQRVVAGHQAAMEAWLRVAAERPAKLPPPPPELDLPEPERYVAFASEPAEAAIVSLPEGSYTIRLRGADGGIVPGSEREVTSFAPLSEGTGYVVRPEDRWTQPLVSFAPDEAVYTTGRTDLFFQPVPVLQYRAALYSRLFRPQSVESVDPSLTLWAPQPARDATGAHPLSVWTGGERVATAPLTPFRVAQLPGAARGYAIEPFAPGEGNRVEPDFRAMRIAREAQGRIGLAEGDGDATAPGSARSLRLVDPPPLPVLFLPALLPLVVGLALRAGAGIRRRRAAGTPGGPAISGGALAGDVAI